MREKNERGRFVRTDGTKLAGRLHPNLAQNTLSQSIKALRDKMTEVMRDRLDLDCGSCDVIDNGGKGYHLRDWIKVEMPNEALATAGLAAQSPVGNGGGPKARLTERQEWILSQLAGGAKLTRRQIEKQFGISERTAKRELVDLVDAGKIVFDRSANPGHYRLAI